MKLQWFFNCNTNVINSFAVIIIKGDYDAYLWGDRKKGGVENKWQVS